MNDLAYQKSLGRLSSVHLFEVEACKDYKLSETDHKTQLRLKLLSIA